VIPQTWRRLTNFEVSAFLIFSCLENCDGVTCGAFSSMTSVGKLALYVSIVEGVASFSPLLSSAALLTLKSFFVARRLSRSSMVGQLPFS